MMESHPPLELLERYHARALPADDLIRVSEHLALCERCRAAVGADRAVHAAAAALRSTLDTLDSHPSADELAAYVDETLDRARRSAIDAHVSGCDICRVDLADLSAVQREIGPVMPAPRVLRFPAVARHRRLVELAAAAAIVAAVGWLMTRTAGPAGVLSSGPAAERTPPAEPSVAARGALIDHGRRITLGVDGQLRGVHNADAADLVIATRAVAESRLVMPAALAGLNPPAGLLMGEPAAPANFRVVAPVGTFVESDRPTLRWTRQPGVAAYEASVFDSALNRIASSGIVEADHWTPAAPLPRGRVLVWQVAAHVAGERMVAPAPGAPEARFEIVGAELSAAVSAARVRLASSHLLLGAWLAEAGLLDDAEASLRALQQENPGSAEVSALVAQVARARRR
jgi:anti-sigma factor ChrR (cupin superfamily)